MAVKPESLYNDLLRESNAPASVVDNTGRLIYMNQAMKYLVDHNLPHGSLRCSWIEESGGECPDCSERPAMNDRCFVRRTESEAAKLFSAFHLPDFGNALVRVYNLDNGKARADAFEATAKLQSVSKTATGATESVTLRPFDAGEVDGLLTVNLKKLIDTLLEREGFSDSDFFNHTPGDVLVSATNPAILQQVVRKIFRSFSHIDATQTPSIEYLEQKAGTDERITHLLSISITTRSKFSAKGESSEVSATAIRLERFTRLLEEVTGFAIKPPKFFRLDNSIVAQFSFHDTMTRSDTTYRFLSTSPPLFSPREKEVVELVRLGWDNDAISKRLGITSATVKQNLKNIYLKAAVKSRVELIFKTPAI